MDFLSYLVENFKSIIKAVLNVLPDSPIVFLTKSEIIAEYMGYVNWFIPIYTWIGILENWLVCIAVYYVVQIILRWAKAIQ